jgi:hypothetical protein
VGSKRLRHRAKLSGRRARSRNRAKTSPFSRSDTFPSFGDTDRFPRGLLIFAFVGVGLALLVFVAQVLALHHVL